MRLVVGLSGASGVIYGVRFLEELKARSIESHLIVTNAAKKLIPRELNISLEDVEKLSTHNYEVDDIFAPIASGSFLFDGMVVIPCSMKTLAGISCGYADNLLLRTAMVSLKERRRLVLVPRETPLSSIDLENMLKLSKIGVTILPAMPAFYHKPKNIGELIAYVIGKTLDAFNIEHNLFTRWGNT